MRTTRICELEGCDKKHMSQGYCNMHYLRFRNNGDPLITRRPNHGMRNTPEWRAWRNLRQRCLRPTDPHYKDYGGRGITVSDDWLIFENFYRDMGDRPSRTHSIDRRDNDAGYSAENCRWATKSEQALNRRKRTNSVVL